jgi:hypothetical protein
MNKNKKLILGSTKDKQLILKTNTLNRHFASFGSSGSGKTVLCKVLIEELSMAGIPVIAFDPQGDISSLAISGDQHELEMNGADLAIQNDFNENVEVVIWTPGSSKGIPLSINPFQFEGISNLNTEDQTRYFSSTSKNIASLIGYDLDNDDRKTVEVILTVIFEYCFKENIVLQNFVSLVKILEDMPDNISKVVDKISSKKILQDLSKKLNLLTLGSRKLIFQTGVPANIETLLGIDGSSNKTRISVIYLNTLNSIEEKEFFISSITQLLYQWMLKNPLANGQDYIQCALFIDEIAPYIPPVKVPACKYSLELLFRQGRKYGVSCLIATQSPGDIDYKAIGQFSTFILGALNTKQEIDKVKKRLESVSKKEIDFIITKLPALKSGNFLAISPEEFDNVQEMKVRWLYTEHRVISEKELKQINLKHLIEFYNKQREESQVIEKQSDNEIIIKHKEAIKSNDKVLVAQNSIFERDLIKKVNPFLDGKFFKSEELINTRFDYLPLIKVELIIFDKKGIFRKKTIEIEENLYLDFKTEKVLYIEDKHFKFANVIDKDPHRIKDLDHHTTIHEKEKNEVDYDFRSLGGKKLNRNKITKLMERKYMVQVNHVQMILFPTWICEIKNKKSGKLRKLKMDGIYGNQLYLNK